MLDMILAAKSNYKKNKEKKNKFFRQRFLLSKAKQKGLKGQGMAGTLLGILVFLSAFAFIISGIFNRTAPLLILNPLVLGGILTALGAAILAGNAAPFGAGVRGIALAAMMAIFVPVLFIDFITLGVPLALTAVVIAPLTIVFFYIILESSKA